MGAPVISVHQALLFAQERGSEHYVCHLHLFIHNFSDDAMYVTSILLVMHGIALETIEVDPNWPVSYPTNTVPVVIDPQNYIEFHTYFDIGTTLHSGQGELILVMDGCLHRKLVPFSITQK